NTKESKDIFKANGFRWSPKKTSWYFAPTTKEKRRYSGKKSLAEIRTHYGSKTIAKGYRRQLA
ncbi:MAG: J domain-containing protein, partial [Nanoarchaeota archaeon]|nr:J domain-containing protein [Nanoarchaeota archaeon]